MQQQCNNNATTMASESCRLWINWSRWLDVKYSSKQPEKDHQRPPIFPHENYQIIQLAIEFLPLEKRVGYIQQKWICIRLEFRATWVHSTWFIRKNSVQFNQIIQLAIEFDSVRIWLHCYIRQKWILNRFEFKAQSGPFNSINSINWIKLN